MLRYIISCLLIGACTCMQLTKLQDCGSSGGTIHSVHLDPCHQEPCTIHKGQTYTAHVNFTAIGHHKMAKNVCHGIFAGVPTPFAVDPANACGNGMICPVESGVTQIYTASVTCPAEAPQSKMAGKWEVKDENNRDILCFVFPLTIM